MRASLALLTFLAGFSTACNECGTYQYKGVLATEWCGTVYGSQGQHWDEDGDADGAGVYAVEFAHDTPPGEFDFEHYGLVRALFLVDALERRAEYDAESALVTCSYVDYRDPRNGGDDVVYQDEPAESAAIVYRGRVPNPSFEAHWAKFDWEIACGAGVFALDARDTVEMERVTGRHPSYDALIAAQGGETTGDSGS